MAMMYKSQLQEVSKSSRDFISAPTDEPSSGSWKEISKAGAFQYLQKEEWLQEALERYHFHSLDGGRENRCSSVLVQRVDAPVSVVWSLVRRFDKPQICKKFVRNCFMRGELGVGCLRDVRIISGLLATTITERLDILDEEQHILSFSIVGGDTRLNNYRSITTLHERVINGKLRTIVIESYEVDVPHGNSKEETYHFTNNIMKCNLQSLANISQHLTRNR